jgi:ATP-dependent RNA helicase DeaD
MIEHNIHLDKFISLGITNEDILNNLLKLNFQSPTPIQEAAIGKVLSGLDCLCKAQTGTGKTAAFALPLVQKFFSSKKKNLVLVLAPTRELATQIQEAFSTFYPKINIALLYGGSSYTKQFSSLQNASFIIGTPGRVIDHIKKGTLVIDNLETLVLDEADKMLMMGFIDDIKYILEKTPQNCQKLLFSATISTQIRTIAQQYLHNEEYINIQSKTATADTIDQKYVIVPKSTRLKVEILSRIITIEQPESILIFVDTKRETMVLAQQLQKNNITALGINGDLEQQQREFIIQQFKNQKALCLVATDVVARGLDIDHVTHVINYSVPLDNDSYIHRIGRTGRYNRKGTAILFLEEDQGRQLSQLEKFISAQITRMEIPDHHTVNEHKIAIFQSQLKEIIGNNSLNEFQDLAQKLIREYQDDYLKIIKGLLFKINKYVTLYSTETKILDLQFSNTSFIKSAPQRRYSRERTGERNYSSSSKFIGESSRERRSYSSSERNNRINENYQTFRLDAGANDNIITSSVLVGIIKSFGCNGKDVGKIKIFPSFTTFTVNKDSYKKGNNGNNISIGGKNYYCNEIHN